MIDFGPHQNPITEDRIREMINWEPRRIKLASDEWWPEVLHQPHEEAQKWFLVLPFQETFKNAFSVMCADVNHYPHLSPDNRCCIYLNSSRSDEGESDRKAKAWIQTVGKYIAIRDCLALSFAMDYRMEGGDPQGAKTQVGELCLRAKPYEGNSAYDRKAARELADLCVAFLRKMTCYNSADSVVAMPPSRRRKPFDLPRYLAREVASALGKEDLCDNVRTIRNRRSLKELPLGEKFDELEGTVEVDQGAFRGKRVLIIDDLYQSGISANYVAMLLLQAGARKVFGLACEKTSRNDANIG